MEEKKDIYREIQKRLSGVTANSEQISTVNAFFSVCQQYYWCYIIRKNMKHAENVLQNYFDESDYIAQRKIDLEKMPKPRFSLVQKMYLEFLGEIYDEYYKGKMKYEDLIAAIYFNNKDGKRYISNCFKEVPTSLLNELSDIMYYAMDNVELSDYIFRRCDYSNIHNAMHSVKEALHTPVPSIDISVKEVVTQERLDTILTYLENDNIVGVLFTVAPITKDLTTKSDKSGHIVNFINISCEYNLEQLKNRIKAVKMLVKQYDDVMDKLNDYRRISV